MYKMTNSPLTHLHGGERQGGMCRGCLFFHDRRDHAHTRMAGNIDRFPAARAQARLAEALAALDPGHGLSSTGAGAGRGAGWLGLFCDLSVEYGFASVPVGKGVRQVVSGLPAGTADP